MPLDMQVRACCRSASAAASAASHPCNRPALTLYPVRVDVQVRMRVWERGSGGERSAAPLIDARSSTCAVEVGGGPWWDTWRTEVRFHAWCCIALMWTPDSSIDADQRALLHLRRGGGRRAVVGHLAHRGALSHPVLEGIEVDT